MLLDPDERTPRSGPPPGAPQSLSPFESRTTTLVVLWSVLVISSLVLVVCWALFS